LTPPINFAQFRTLMLPGGDASVALGTFHACRLRLVSEMEGHTPSPVIQELLNGEAPQSALDLRVRNYQLHGVLSGFRNWESLVPGGHQPAEIGPEAMDPLDWTPEKIVRVVRQEAFSAKGRLNPAALWVAEKFYEAGWSVFALNCRGSRPTTAWKSMSRYFARWVSWRHDVLDVKERVEMILRLGRDVARLLAFDYRVGLSAGLDYSGLYSALHLRDPIEYVAAAGRRMGRLEGLGIADCWKGSGILQLNFGEKGGLQKTWSFLKALPHSLSAYDELIAEFSRSEKTRHLATALGDCRRWLVVKAVVENENRWIEELEDRLRAMAPAYDRWIEELLDSPKTRPVGTFLREHLALAIKAHLNSSHSYDAGRLNWLIRELPPLWDKYERAIAQGEGAGERDGRFANLLGSGDLDSVRELQSLKEFLKNDR